MEQTYVMTNHDLLLDGSGKRYELRVRDLPQEEKPRERLSAEGPAALSVQELLAIVLTTGTKKEEVLSMATRIVNEYGDRNALMASDAKVLAADLDIPLVKAMQIVAVGELGRRFFRKQKNGAAIIRTARDVYDYTVDMRTLPKEHLRGLYLDAHYQVIHDETLSIGTIDANLIHPREVFRPALAHAAAAVVLVHNHPSGVVTPSEADCMVTQQIAAAGRILGIELVDHVVITEDTFTSISTEFS
ncbi:MAG: DNA repair protein RadC [Parcubacteria bacterium C7867-007]|nr:MAG: DNA repair protein RadC [Parcubacteria bacterium C7867-007]